MLLSVRKSEGLDPRQYPDDLARVLAQLHNFGVENDQSWTPAAEISRALRDRYGIRIHWRTVDAVLGRHPDSADRRKRQRRWEYLLLAEGEALIRRGSHQILLVEPDKAVQAVIGLHELLSRLGGSVLVCDPYVDATTIEHLEACPKAQTIQLLTQTIRHSGKLRRLLSAMSSSGYLIDIRVSPGNDLHDRYIIDAAGMIILGTSLNGFGKKQCFIIRAGQDLRAAMMRDFARRWSTAPTWP